MAIAVIFRGGSGRRLCRQKSLGFGKESGVDDRQMLAIVDQFAVADLADVHGVRQQVIEIATAEWLSGWCRCRSLRNAPAQSGRFGFIGEGAHRLELEVAIEEMANR